MSSAFQATVAEFRHHRHLHGVVGDRRQRREPKHQHVLDGRRDVRRGDGDAGDDDGLGDGVGADDGDLGHRKSGRHRQERFRAERPTSGRSDQQLFGEHLDDAATEAEEEPQSH